MPPTADVVMPSSRVVGSIGGAGIKSSISNNMEAAPETTYTMSPRTDHDLRSVDDLLRTRAAMFPDQVVVSYPASGLDYVDYTFRQLDVYAHRVARALLHAGIRARTSSHGGEERAVVAMLGPSNIEYLITMLALMKLGHTTLFLSTRIPAMAIEALVKETKAEYVIADPRFGEHVAAVKGKVPELKVLGMPTREVFEFALRDDERKGVVDTQLDGHLDSAVEMERLAYIIHSSGSTGVPKAIYQIQRAALANFSGTMDMKAFITLPLYHNHGVCNFYRALWCRKPIHLYNADLPLTSDYLVQIMRAHKFEIFYGVPYALKLLAESEEGLRLLAELKVVMYGGSACPDDLGDTLVANGVNLISHYGATEVGQLMTSARPKGDPHWNYVRESARLTPYLRWVPQGPNLFEACVLPGWPSKTTTNMPDGSYRTKDLFEPHPTIPKAWKYIARLDDTIVLVNGEKFNPVTTEGRIRSSRLVTEAVMFGAQQPYLGVLIVPSAETAGKTPAEVLELVWPVVEAAQRDDDAFAKLSREMVVILPHGVDYPRTDKGSVIRQAFYREFTAEIELAYKLSSATGENAKTMSEDEVKQFLRGLVVHSIQRMGGSIPTVTAGEPLTDDSDFFALGLDSLQSIQIRAEIVKNVKTEHKLTQNVVYDHSSINKLAAYLVGKPQGVNGGNSNGDAMTIEDQMRALVKKYADFERTMSQNPKNTSTKGKYVVVTGSTGSLGAHIVAALAQDPSVERIYCLNRGTRGDQASAQRRTVDSMTLRKCYDDITEQDKHKIIALPADLSREDLGLDQSVYTEITSSLRAVIHAAWAVNFNLGLASFERDNIAGLRNLITLCQQATAGQSSFNFCSSVSVVARYPRDKLQGNISPSVPETEANPTWAQGMGYAQSKSVAEALCARAAETTTAAATTTTSRVPVRVLRIGQIVADTRHGIWNATEAVPMMIQSALTVGALPRLEHESPSWLPVDTVARGVVDISLSFDDDGDDGSATFTNVVNHRAFSWNRDLLPALREVLGVSFDELSPREWVQRLRGSDPDPVANPPIKLLDFFAGKYDKDEFPPSMTYDTAVARWLSRALEDAPVLDAGFVRLFVEQFLQGAWKSAKVVARG